MDNPSPAFGPDTPPEANFASIAAQLRTLDTTKMSVSSMGDVLTMIEWLRKETLKQVDELAKERARLQIMEKSIAQREEQAEIRIRAAALIVQPRKGWRRYFGG